MEKRILSFLLSVTTLLSGVFIMSSNLQVSALTQADAATSFTFSNGKMSKEVLRSYASRAITHQGFTITNATPNPIFEEDLRMIRRIGAKYIGRAAFYSWGGNMTAEQIETHYRVAKERATLAHQADPELILQAGVFEIAYKGTVENTKIPAYVFEAFGQKVENRNFVWREIVFPEGTKTKDGQHVGVGCWGNTDSGMPDIEQLETKMYFYYQITRYIDAGYEAFHMGQAEKMMRYMGNSLAYHWDDLLTKARAYAKTHARRGLVLFDYHNYPTSEGIKMGNRWVFDIQAAGMVPVETQKENVGTKDEVWKAESKHYTVNSSSWIGRTTGGKHPLGFDVEANFTIVEFDNYGQVNTPGESNGQGFGAWGYDDVTWFATQPAWYRNQFLKETAAYYSTTKSLLDSEGKQVYFLQPVCRRVITPEIQDCPTIEYIPTENANLDFVFYYADKENLETHYDANTNVFSFTVRNEHDYRANNQSDGCPNGFGQEDAIREIFLGKDAPEDPELIKVVFPSEFVEEEYITPAPGASSQATGNISSNKNNQTANSKPVSGNQSATASNQLTNSGAIESQEETASEEVPNTSYLSDSSDANTNTDQPKGNPLPWIITGILAALALGGGGVGFYFLYYKKKQ